MAQCKVNALKGRARQLRARRDAVLIHGMSPHQLLGPRVARGRSPVGRRWQLDDEKRVAPATINNIWLRSPNIKLLGAKTPAAATEDVSQALWTSASSPLLRVSALRCSLRI